MRPTTKITKLQTRENFELNEKIFEPMKYPREKTLDPRNTQKIFGTRITYEKIFWTREIPTGKYSGPTRKYFGPTKYP